MAIVLLVLDKPNVRSLITERAQPSLFENYIYSKTFEANTSFILFLLFNVFSLVKHAIEHCGFSAVSVCVMPLCIKSISFGLIVKAKICKTPVLHVDFRPFSQSQVRQISLCLLASDTDAHRTFQRDAQGFNIRWTKLLFRKMTSVYSKKVVAKRQLGAKQTSVRCFFTNLFNLH